MAEYWKSTPSYWCKFCSIYVKDTGIERKNHETSAKHQNAIQRNLRELQKGKQREDRDQQRAKDEVARLNGLVNGQGSAKAGGSGGEKGILGVKEVGRAASSASTGPTLSASAQRKKHAEQLAAMGVELPEELKREVTGVGGWQTVSERVVEEEQQPWNGDIKNEEDNKEDVKDAMSRGVRKRKPEEGEEEEEQPQKKAWGSKFRQYPGADGDGVEGEDLDALLSGVTAKKPKVEVKNEETEEVKKEEGEEKPLDAVPDVNASAANVKQEEGQEQTAPAVVFKKRKVKK